MTTEGFSVNGELVFYSFSNNHLSDSSLSSFTPLGKAGQVYYLNIFKKSHEEIQRLISLLNIKIRLYDFDIRVDKNDTVFFIEMGVRIIGNMIPHIKKYATGVDLIEYD